MSGANLRTALAEVERRLLDETLPDTMLDDLGMNRQQLDEFIRRYRRQLGEGEPVDEEPGADTEKPPVAGSVLETGPERAEDVTIESGAPAGTQKDSLRSRFEDESGKISPRYREAVNAYYKKLSEER